jgi:hypothetical protein
MPSSRLLSSFAPRARAAAAALAVAGGALLALPSTPSVTAGEPDAGSPAASVPQTPRFAALEQEIRHLERSLQAMRRARAELTAGRPEPVPVDTAGRAATDARRAALREVCRYEAARAKALAAHAEAVSAKDDAKVAEARAALDAADTAFVAAVQKIDARADAKAAPAEAAPDAKGAAAPTPALGRSPGRRGARRGGDGSSMGSGDDLDDADESDED